MPLPGTAQPVLADVWVCEMEAYRDYAKFKKCSGCELLAWCRGCPAVAGGAHGDFYDADPQCWRGEMMELLAAELGIASCIVAWGEETFDNGAGEALIREWDVPDGYIARCFVLLGYCAGDYPDGKPRKAGRCKIVEESHGREGS